MYGTVRVACVAACGRVNQAWLACARIETSRASNREGLSATCSPSGGGGGSGSPASPAITHRANDMLALRPSHSEDTVKHSVKSRGRGQRNTHTCASAMRRYIRVTGINEHNQKRPVGDYLPAGENSIDIFSIRQLMNHLIFTLYILSVANQP